MTCLVIVRVGLWSALRGGVEERGMSAGTDGTINQDCRGIKIEGWGSGRTEESGAYNSILQILLTKPLTSHFEVL